MNDFGNAQRLICASDEKSYNKYTQDYPAARGHDGTTACTVLLWPRGHVERSGSWTDLAWWTHDQPSHSNRTSPKLLAFNINWHERPVRHVDSYVAPRGSNGAMSREHAKRKSGCKIRRHTTE